MAAKKSPMAEVQYDITAEEIAQDQAHLMKAVLSDIQGAIERNITQRTKLVERIQQGEALSYVLSWELPSLVGVEHIANHSASALKAYNSKTTDQIEHSCGAPETLERLIWVLERIQEELVGELTTRCLWQASSTSPSSNTIDQYKAVASSNWLREINTNLLWLRHEAKSQPRSVTRRVAAELAGVGRYRIVEK